jgi:hypothetical protein
MKNKTILGIMLSALTVFSVAAQTSTPAHPPTSVTGTMNINFATLQNPPGPADVYNLNVQVADNITPTVSFHGNISAQTYKAGGWGGWVKGQNGNLNFNLACDLVNPKRPSQIKNLGTIAGTVPIDQNNVYYYNQGNVTTSIFDVGQIQGFKSKYDGYVLGKHSSADTSWMAKLKSAASSLTFSKSVNGKTVSIVVTNFDKMEFRDFVIGQGPTRSYPDASVSGQMIYDGSRNAWFFQNLVVSYGDADGKGHSDKITGDIRWQEDGDRAHNGKGAYTFDVRVNEPVASDSSVFAPAAGSSGGGDSDDAFFAADNSVTGLSGTWNYVDTLATPGDDNSATLSSQIAINLTGNNISKQQTMYLTKLFVMVCIVPFND